MNGRKQLRRGCLLFCLLVVILPGFLIWREMRRERLSAQLLAVLKEEPSLSGRDYPGEYTEKVVLRPDLAHLKPQILREEAAVVRFLQAGADPDVRDVIVANRPFWEDVVALLKRIFERPSAFTASPESALAIAVKTNDALIVTALLKAGAHDVNAEIKIGSDVSSGYFTQYPLVSYGAYNGNKEIVAELCAHGADIHKLDSQGAPILQSVLEGSTLELTSEKQNKETREILDRKRRTEIFHLLLAKGATYEPNSKIGYALLSAAVAGDFLDLTRELLAAGVPPNAKPEWTADPPEESPLDTAVANDDFTLVELLLQYGASTRYAMLSANSTKMAGLLLAHGVDIHAVTTGGKREGENRLNFACLAGDKKMVLFLIEHGLNPNSGGDYASPIDEAAVYADVAMVRMLLQHGAKVGPHSPGASALWLAIAEQHFDSAKLLLQYGAAVNPRLAASVDDREYPLTEAANQDSVDMALELIARGADVNAGKGGAILAACESCDEDLVELLLKHGADPTVRAQDGTTAIQIVQQNADPPGDADGVITLLKKHGAKRE